MEVGDRDLGGRDQVQVVARRDVHLVFLVGDLPGAARGRRVHDRRRPDLGEAVLGGVDVQEPGDQAALEPRAGALVDREPGAGDLRAARVVDDVECLADLPVGPALPGGAVRRHDLAGAVLAPGPDRDVGLLAAHRDLGVGGVGDAQEQVLELGLGRRQLGVDLVDAQAGRRRRGTQLAPPRGRPGARRRGWPRRSACEAALRSALRPSDSDWSRRRRASTSMARSTSAGSSRLSMAPWRIRSGSSRSR